MYMCMFFKLDGEVTVIKIEGIDGCLLKRMSKESIKDACML